MQCAIRSSLATLIVLGLVRLRGMPVTARDGTLVAGLVAGVLFGVEFLLIYRGLLYTTATRAVLFIYLAPFFVVLGARWFFPGDRFGLMQWLGLLLSFVGMVVAFGVPAPALVAASAARRSDDGRRGAAGPRPRWSSRRARSPACRRKRRCSISSWSRPDGGARRARLRRTDRGHAVGAWRSARSPIRPSWSASPSPVVRADRQVFGEPAVGLHVPDAAVRGRGRSSGAGRAVDAGFRRSPSCWWRPGWCWSTGPGRAICLPWNMSMHEAGMQAARRHIGAGRGRRRDGRRRRARSSCSR